jgi:ParB family chromosome partitioning protein
MKPNVRLSPETHPPVIQRIDLAPSEIVPDDTNRTVVEDDDFVQLVDSIRLFGILEPLKLRARPDGRYDLLDGHRRYAAAHHAALATAPCEIWPADITSADAVARALILNHHRKQPGVLDTARQLRRLKNEFALTHEQLAARTSLPLDRIKLYLSLFAASDHLLSFFEDNAIPLAFAVEFMRYEKAMGEAAARRLIKRHQDTPLSHRTIATLRKRKEQAATGEPSLEGSPQPPPRLRGRIEAAFRRDAAAAFLEIESALGQLGYRLVKAGS